MTSLVELHEFKISDVASCPELLALCAHFTVCSKENWAKNTVSAKWVQFYDKSVTEKCPIQVFVVAMKCYDKSPLLTTTSSFNLFQLKWKRGGETVIAKGVQRGKGGPYRGILFK